MASVWVITTGSYSDYRVLGICSTREKAEQVSKYLDATHEPQEIEVDAFLSAVEQGLNFYVASMRRDGEMAEADVSKYYDVYCSEPYIYLSSFPKKLPDGRWDHDNPYRDDVIFGHIWARDEQHAIKILNEKRVQVIANGWRVNY